MNCNTIQAGAEIPFVLVLKDCKTGDPIAFVTGDTFSVRFRPQGGPSFDRAFASEGGLPSSDGRITYQLTASDLTVPGTCRVQGFVTRSGRTIPSMPGTFVVGANLEAP